MTDSNKKPKVGSKWVLKKDLTLKGGKGMKASKVKTKKKPKEPSKYTIRRVPKIRKKPTSFWV